jgi:hypothetical protein
MERKILEGGGLNEELDNSDGKHLERCSFACYWMCQSPYTDTFAHGSNSGTYTPNTNG